MVEKLLVPMWDERKSDIFLESLFQMLRNLEDLKEIKIILSLLRFSCVENMYLFSFYSKG